MNTELTALCAALCAAGLYLVKIPPVNGKPTKAPLNKGWNQLKSSKNPHGYSNDPADFINGQNCNIGLYHGESNTLALDLDNVELAWPLLENIAGIDIIDWLTDPDRFEIQSPKDNRAKLIFKLPENFAGAGLHQLQHEGKVIFELRAGNCQDVTIGQHPEGGNYEIIGDPAAIPKAPPVLLDMLKHWNGWKQCFDSELGIEQTPPPIAPRKQLLGEHLAGWRNPITEFNQAFSVEEILERHGYAPAGRDRYIRPGSESQAPGAVILRKCKDGVERVFSHGGDVLNDKHSHDAFDCYRLLECGGKW